MTNHEPQVLESDSGAAMHAVSSEILPFFARLIWAAAAVAGAVGLVLAYGFREPIASATTVRMVLAAGLMLFAISRILLLFPLRGPLSNLRRWWVDYVLLAAAAVWRMLQPASESIILPLGAVYVLVISAAALAGTIIRRLVKVFAAKGSLAPLSSLFAGGLVLALLGGAVLALPACWSKPYVAEKATQYANHGLNCFFTATAALSGTGLTPLDIGQDFTPAGQMVILVLMQIGGLLTLVIASAAAWRFRQIVGWGASDEDHSAAGLRRLLRFVVAAAVVLELLAVVPLYHMWDAGSDANFARQWPTPLPGGLDGPRVLAGLFHSVSAFCNVGLTLPREGLLAYGGAWPVYAVLLPLILLGGLGGTVLYELWRRVTGREPTVPGLRCRSSAEARVTLVGTVVMLLVPAGLLLAIESTTRWQLRYPRENIAGRLQLGEAGSSAESMVFATDESGIRSVRMRSMPPGKRTLAAVFQSAAARTGGMRTVRLDEASISPASRWVLMACMLTGGGLGGAAGGLRIAIVFILLGALFSRRVQTGSDFGNVTADGSGRLTSLMIRRAAGIAAGMLLLVAGTTLALLYAETGSFEACVFEAVSACCNVGLSTGLTAQLSPVGRSVLPLAMLLGRVLPLALLLRVVVGQPAGNAAG